MAGIYGDFLGHFSELREQFTFETFVAKVGGGYEITGSGTFTGIRQTADRFMNDRHGVLHREQAYILWTETKLDATSIFVIIDGKRYRIPSDAPYNREGGFYRYELHVVVGWTDETESPSVTTGTFL